LVGRLAGDWSTGWGLVDWLGSVRVDRVAIGWSVGSIGWDWLVGWLDWLVGWLRFVGRLAGIGRLARVGQG
jgi:hypothetical protein